LKNDRATAVHRKIRRLKLGLLGIWLLVSFAWLPFARVLDFAWGDWTFSYWMAAQGCFLSFLALTIVNAHWTNRWEKELEALAALDGQSAEAER
jgi:putative solute:sodium symporter small subunit